MQINPASEQRNAANIRINSRKTESGIERQRSRILFIQTPLVRCQESALVTLALAERRMANSCLHGDFY